MKTWDLNIYFLEVEPDEWLETLKINPCIYISGPEGTDHIYTETVWDLTFAETRYIVSQRPADEWGSDWWEFADNFAEIAPPRIKKLIDLLPDLED